MTWNDNVHDPACRACRGMTEPAEFEGLVQRNLAASCSFSYPGFAALLHHILKQNLYAALNCLVGTSCQAPVELCTGSSRTVVAAKQNMLCMLAGPSWSGLHLRFARHGLGSLKQSSDSNNGNGCSCICLQPLLHALLNLKRLALAMQELMQDMVPAADLEQQPDCALFEAQVWCLEGKDKHAKGSNDALRELQDPSLYCKLVGLPQTVRVCGQDIEIVQRLLIVAGAAEVQPRV